MSPREPDSTFYLSHVESSESLVTLEESAKTESTSSSSDESLKKSVSFATVHVREYNRTVGDNPDVRVGPPISLSWEYVVLPEQTIDDYEASKPDRRKRYLRLSSITRRNLLITVFGIPEEEVRKAEEEAKRVHKLREHSNNQSKASEKVEVAVRSAKRKIGRSIRKSFFKGLSAASASFSMVPLGAM